MNDRVKIKDLINKNIQTKKVLDIMKLYDIPNNNNGNIRGDRKIYNSVYDELEEKLAKELEERKNLVQPEEVNNNFDEEKVLKAFKDFDNQIKIKKTEENYKKKQKFNALKAAKDATKETVANTLYGMAKGISGSGAGLLGLGENLLKYSYNKIKDPKNTKFLEEITKPNVWLESQKDFDEMMANVLDVQDALDTNDKNDKRLQTIGEFIVPQTYLGKPFKYTSKLFKDPKAAESALKYMLPGPQVTKGASTGKKLLEVGAQTPVALGFDELMSGLTNSQGFFGDYREKPEKEITLINDKRRIGKKQYVDELKPDTITKLSVPNEETNLDGWKKYSPFHDNDGTINGLTTTTGIVLGSIFAGSQIAKRVYQYNKNKLEETINNTPANKLDELFNNLFSDANNTKIINPEGDLIKYANKKSNNIRKNMSFSEKLDNSLADRLNVIDIMKRNGSLTPNKLYDLSKDLNTQIDSIFNTGQLTKDIKFRSSPYVFDKKIANLKTINRNLYDLLEETIERASIIQDETNRYNRLLLNKIGKDLPDLSPDEYLNARLSNKINVDLSNQYYTNNALIDLSKQQEEALKILRNNPVTKDILDDLEDYTNKMLDYANFRNVYSTDTTSNLKKNRTFQGLMSYKPRKEQIDLKWYEKLSNMLYHNVENKNRVNNLSKVRTPGVVGEGVNFLETFENTLKGAILDIESNARVRDFYLDAIKNQAQRTNKILDENIDKNIKLFHNMTKGGTYSFGTKEFDEEFRRLVGINNKKAFKKITDVTIVRPLGVEDLKTNQINKPKDYYSSVLNREHQDNWLDNTVANTFGEREDKITKAIKEINNSDDIISFIDNDKIYYFQTDPINKKAFEVSNELPGLIGRMVKKAKDFRQSTITGKLNPAFSVPSSIYTLTENLVALKHIAKDLQNKINLNPDDITKAGYMKRLYESGKELLAQGEAKKGLDAATLEFTKMVDGNLDNIAKENLNNFQKRYNDLLISKVQDEGLISSKPFNANSGVYYTLNKETPLSENIRSAIINHNSLQKGKRLVNTIDYVQTALREAPSYAMLKYLGEKSGAIVNNEIKDLDKLTKIGDTLSKSLANMGRHGSHLGAVGAVGKFIEDYALYGHVLFQSLAPKLRNLGIGKGLTNINKDIKTLLSPSKTNLDLLNQIKQQIRQVKDNTYLQSFITAGAIPSLLTYAWNHSSKENRDAYYGISDYDKASRLYFVNALGNGRHITIPLEQEVAVIKQISDLILDTTFGGSKNNLYDPNFDQTGPLMESLNRSLFVDDLAGLDVIGTLSGKKININPLDSRFGINDIKKDTINQDLTRTAKEDGILSNFALNGINVMFNTLGRILTDAIEEGNVGAKVSKTQAFKDVSASVLSNLFKPTNLYSSKFTSYNSTSKYVYDKMSIITDLGKISDKMTPEQKIIYNYILTYKRNLIDPLHDKLNEFKRTGRIIDSNGSINGQNLTNGYFDRKLKTKNVNKGIAELFSMEYNLYEDLNKLLSRDFGTTLERFMKE